MVLSLIFFLLSILIPGALILALWFDVVTKGFFKKIALAYGLGTLLLTLEIFIIVFVVRQSVNWLYLILPLEILILSWLYLKRFGGNFFKRLKPEPKNISLVEIFLMIALAWEVITTTCLAWLSPVMNWDSVAMWSFKAKILFYNMQGFFDQASPWFWQKQNYSMYPWLIPLTQYWLTVLNKDFNEAGVNFIFVGFFIAVICLLYGYLRNYLNRALSLLLVLLLATMPLISYHAYNAYADLPLAFYLGAAFILTYKWLDSKNNKYLILSWLFLVGAFFTKNEAIIFIIAQVLILLPAKLSLKVKWKTIFCSALPGLVAIIPWLVWRFVYKIPISNVAKGLGWHPQVIGQFLHDLFMAASWNVWYYIFFGLSLLFIRQIIKDRSLALAYGLWCLFLGGFFVLYLCTEEYQWAMDGTALSRNLINFIPSSVWLLGLLLRQEFFASHKFFKD